MPGPATPANLRTAAKLQPIGTALGMCLPPVAPGGEASTTEAILQMPVEARARHLTETRDLLRALSTIRDDAKERMHELQIKFREQHRLQRSQPQGAQVIVQVIVSLKADLSNMVQDVASAAKDIRDLSAILSQLKKSEKAWQEFGLAGVCAECEQTFQGRICLHAHQQLPLPL